MIITKFTIGYERKGMVGKAESVAYSLVKKLELPKESMSEFNQWEDKQGIMESVLTKDSGNLLSGSDSDLIHLVRLSKTDLTSILASMLLSLLF